MNNRQAITYQALYLSNLLLLPVLSFILLAIWLFNHNANTRRARIHLIRAVQLSMLAGILLLILPALVILLSSAWQQSAMLMLVYVLTLHSIFVLLGMLNLARAMANKLPVF